MTSVAVPQIDGQVPGVPTRLSVHEWPKGIPRPSENPEYALCGDSIGIRVLLAMPNGMTKAIQLPCKSGSCRIHHERKTRKYRSEFAAYMDANETLGIPALDHIYIGCFDNGKHETGERPKALGNVRDRADYRGKTSYVHIWSDGVDYWLAEADLSSSRKSSRVAQFSAVTAETANAIFAELVDYPGARVNGSEGSVRRWYPPNVYANKPEGSSASGAQEVTKLRQGPEGERKRHAIIRRAIDLADPVGLLPQREVDDMLRTGDLPLDGSSLLSGADWQEALVQAGADFKRGDMDEPPEPPETADDGDFRSAWRTHGTSRHLRAIDGGQGSGTDDGTNNRRTA